MHNYDPFLSCTQPAFLWPLTCFQPPFVWISTCINPACIKPACIKPDCIKPAFIKPACIKPACIKPACINPACIKPACIKPACIKPALWPPTYIQAASFWPPPPWFQPPFLTYRLYPPSFSFLTCIQPAALWLTSCIQPLCFYLLLVSTLLFSYLSLVSHLSLACFFLPLTGTQPASLISRLHRAYFSLTVPRLFLWPPFSSPPPVDLEPAGDLVPSFYLACGGSTIDFVMIISLCLFHNYDIINNAGLSVILTINMGAGGVMGGRGRPVSAADAFKTEAVHINHQEHAIENLVYYLLCFIYLVLKHCYRII